jgi:tetratricopeptide (TPR) repeat protein
MKEAGAPEVSWTGLLDAASQLPPDSELAGARIAILRPASVQSVQGTGALVVERWLGYPEDVMRTLRQAEDEQDVARTLFVYPWLPRAEIDSIVELARSWRNPAARIRGLVFGAETLLYRFGDFLAAAELLTEVLEIARAEDSPGIEAKGLVRLTLAQLALGELSQAQETADEALKRVRALGDRIIPEHPGDSARDIYPGPSMEANFACFLEGDWPTIADHWTTAASLVERGGVAIVEAGMAAYAHALADHPAEARRLLEQLDEALKLLDPTDWAVNGAVGRGGRAIWMLGCADLAPSFRGYALALISAGVGDWPTVSNHQTVACCAALLGDVDEAEEFFAKAEDQLLAGHHRPQRAILHFDRGLALMRSDVTKHQDAAHILANAAREFDGLQMHGWAQRTHQQLATLAAP